MPHEKQRTLILDNATRLLKDARLLVDHGRFASAFALAVLGVEEIGKTLLKDWEEEKPLEKSKQTLHVCKQTAVASLLMGALMVRLFSDRPSGPHELHAVTKEFNESDEGRLFGAIRGHELDKRKQQALYQDDDLLTAIGDEFAETHVGAIFEIASEAHDVLADHAIRNAGRAFLRDHVGWWISVRLAGLNHMLTTTHTNGTKKLKLARLR